MRIRYSREKNGKAVKKAFVYTSQEHGIASFDVDRDALFIIERLQSNGFESYVVGGAVRDLILGRKPKDFDIVSNASPSQIKKIFRNSRVIGRRFRLVHVFFGPKIFEVATFRSIKDGHTGNTFGTIEEDVLRRDFTFNALFYDPIGDVVVDYMGGIRDLREKRLKPIIPLSLIFVEDPVRMIRAVKYSVATGCKMSLVLRWKIKQQAALLAGVSPSRLTEEIGKIINSGHCAGIVNFLDELGLYEYIQPNAVEKMRIIPSFKEDYLEGFRRLENLISEGKYEPGETMAVLIREYLNRNIQWDQVPGEIYKEAFQIARNFVLPMNPPRIALDNAVRIVFKEHGIVLRKGRAFERPRPKKTDNSVPPKETTEREGPKKRRRRRRQKAELGVSGGDRSKNPDA